MERGVRIIAQRVVFRWGFAGMINLCKFVKDAMGRDGLSSVKRPALRVGIGPKYANLKQKP